MNLITLMDRYSCNEKCRDTLEKIRWPHGVACLKCGTIGIPELPVGGKFQCVACRYQFSVTTGTIMHDSHLPIRTWFLAVYLMCVSKKGMSAHQLHRTLGVSYKLDYKTYLTFPFS